MSAPDNHLLRQAVDGEFSVHAQQAATMTAQQFAKTRGATVRPWGYPLPVYDAVNVDGVEYLWRLRDGKFDGWSMSTGGGA